MNNYFSWLNIFAVCRGKWRTKSRRRWIMSRWTSIPCCLYHEDSSLVTEYTGRIWHCRSGRTSCRLAGRVNGWCQFDCYHFQVRERHSLSGYYLASVCVNFASQSLWYRAVVSWCNGWNVFKVRGPFAFRDSIVRFSLISLLASNEMCEISFFFFREKLTSEIKLMHIPADFIEWSDSVEREDYIESYWLMLSRPR